eukprot:TRINITY_DN8760_c0_g1_i1.p1 TRINITY_DN8760_c0_g1~~TRINITY_DN8760_c0_g1_i1.p1  ORF type:complete len:127 (-),score=15.16 TRINITY_DN8760_c0_g1_i1:175-555(-)
MWNKLLHGLASISPKGASIARSESERKDVPQPSKDQNTNQTNQFKKPNIAQVLSPRGTSLQQDDHAAFFSFFLPPLFKGGKHKSPLSNITELLMTDDKLKMPLQKQNNKKKSGKRGNTQKEEVAKE